MGTKNAYPKHKRSAPAIINLADHPRVSFAIRHATTSKKTPITIRKTGRAASIDAMGAKLAKHITTKHEPVYRSSNKTY